MVKLNKKLLLKIKRKKSADKQKYWEEFDVPYTSESTVIDVLEEIRKNPVNKDGNKTSPVVWESCCNEGSCGACAMVINGKVGLACSAKIADLKKPVILEPLSKFPVVRDLWVDRSKMFDALKNVGSWNNLDGFGGDGPETVIIKKEQEKYYSYTTCIMCGACLEACPQYNERSPFMGAHVMGQILAANNHPTGKTDCDERLYAIMGIGGIAECGNAGNCSEVCPKGIPVSEGIARLGWQTSVQAFRKIFY